MLEVSYTKSDMYHHLLLCLSVFVIQEASASYAAPDCHTVYEEKCHQVS